MKYLSIIALLVFILSAHCSNSQPKSSAMTTPQNKYGLTGIMKAKAGKGDELAAILLEASQLVSSAKGLHIYVVAQDAADQDSILITEVWDSKEDHDNSLKMAGVKELIARAMPIIDGKPEGKNLKVWGGKGVN